MKELNLNPGFVAGLIIDFISEQLENRGFKSLIIGLSGGIDSSTSAYLAVKAVGPENLKGLIIPYKTNPKESIEDAWAVARGLGIEAEEVDITPMVDAYVSLYPDMDRIRKGNIMARQRMIVLYDHSQMLGALVLGTSNKTERLLGYTTIWGDMGCAFTPLGSLYKTQVRDLARYLGVPSRIISKRPSADFWKGQTDEGEIGFTYDEIDRVLHYIADEGVPPSDLEGFDDRLVSSVLKMMRKNEFKRRMPPIAPIDLIEF